MHVERLALVVERGHAHTAPRQLARDGDALRPRLALREHERLEFFAREIAALAEHRHVEIFVERDVAGFERADGLFMTILKIFLIEAKALDRGAALLAIPAVAAEYAANVEEHELDGRRHPTSTARAGAPSNPTSRSGSTRSSYGPIGGVDRSSPSTMMMPRSSSARCV